MDIHETLTSAAKAIGFNLHVNRAGAFQLFKGGKYVRFWNPLSDDSDALQLAAVLGLRLTMPKYKGFGTSAEPQSGGVARCTVFRDDLMQQTREAIVLTASEMGKQMMQPTKSGDSIRGEKK